MKRDNNSGFCKYNITALLMLAVLAIAISFIPTQVAFAGDINGNEAGLIAAASGTFTYDGKSYKAGTAYINSLTAYLSGEDVDLSADQCERAKTRMYESVSEGVSRGYLYEVDSNGNAVSTEADNTSEEKATTEKNSRDKSSTDKKQDDKKSDSTNSGTDQNLSDSSKTDDANALDALDVWDSMSNQSEAKNKLQQRPDEDNANATVKLEDDGIVVITKDNEKINLPKSEQLIPNKVLVIIDIVAAIVFAITLICGAMLAFTKCFVFRKPKKRKARRGHTRRRRIRRYTRNVLTATTAVSLVAIFVFAGIYISIFNKNTIMQNMQSSGYFRYAYSEYIAEKATEVLSGETAIDLDSISDYEDFLFTVKQNSLKILSGETDIRIPSSNVSPYIYNIKKSYMEVFYIAGILFVLSAALGVLLMFFMDQSRERGTKATAFSVLIASAVLVAFTIYMTIVKPYLHLYIEPDYLYLFIMECILWSVKVMTSISAFAVVLGMLLIGVYKSQISRKDS